MLAGCGLPTAWADQRQWRILETGFGSGLDFLAAWRAWKDDPRRPGMLHFAAIDASPVSASDLVGHARAYPELHELAQQLAAQWWGLLPGFHRLSFEQGRVLLTLCVGDVQEMLKQQAFTADTLLLTAVDPQLLKGAARLCRRGTRLAAPGGEGLRQGLEQCGFRIEGVEGAAERLQGVYDPAWQPKGLVDAKEVAPAHCVVIGAGLAGAAVASSLAVRGWQVTVMDAAAGPAAGASGLPAGLLAPHQSPDDNLLSRLSRSGVRITLGEADRLLPGDAWALSGVLENRLGDRRPAPPVGEALQPWTREADVPGAWWHEKAAWIRPAALVRAWLAQPGIDCVYGTRVPDVAALPAGLVVVAAALDSSGLLGGRLALNPVRGQVSWSHAVPNGLPATPWNGHGHFLPRVSLQGGLAWLTGSTYGRGDLNLDERAQDHRANLERLQLLSPQAADLLRPQFDARQVNAWTGVRCASSDRRPLVGPLEPGLWVSTAMGSRGLTFAKLCAELLAARLHGEPWPLERRLADALDVARVLP